MKNEKVYKLRNRLSGATKKTVSVLITAGAFFKKAYFLFAIVWILAGFASILFAPLIFERLDRIGITQQPAVLTTQAGAMPLTNEEHLAIAKQRNDARATMAQIIGGLVILFGVYFTYRRLDVSENQLKVSREQNVTERFSRAVELIGHESLNVRTGAIYALGKIAEDYAVDYHETVMDILCSYIKELSINKNKLSKSNGEDVKKTEKSDEDYVVSSDIQAAITVISRRHYAYKGKKKIVLDLRGVDLRGIKLYKTDDDKYSLEGALLSSTDLRKADLKGADLSSAMLHDADLSGSRLDGANLSGAGLFFAYLISASLDGANLSGTYLYGTNLSGAGLEGADLTDANLINAIMKNAFLIDTDLSKVLNLTREQIESARTYETTILPDYLKDAPPEEA